MSRESNKSNESEAHTYKKEDILDLLREKYAQAARRALRGVVIQPGAIGDCILTLPLIHYIKQILDLGAVDMMAHTDYVGVFPGRTCVDKVRSLESVDLHRLFTNPDTFELAERDTLISAFSEYTWIITFLGGPDTDFEKNLLYTIHCYRSAEVISLVLKPTSPNQQHIAHAYIQQFREQYQYIQNDPGFNKHMLLCRLNDADHHIGLQIIKQMGLSKERLIILHPGSGGRAKCWHLDNFKAVAKALRKQAYQPVFLLGPAEQERIPCNHMEQLQQIAPLLTDLSLEQVLAVFSITKIYIGNDSGITHLAAACGIHTLVLFGETDPHKYSPIGPHVHILHDNHPGFSERPNIKLQKEVLDSLG